MYQLYNILLLLDNFGLLYGVWDHCASAAIGAAGAATWRSEREYKSVSEEAIESGGVRSWGAVLEQQAVHEPKQGCPGEYRVTLSSISSLKIYLNDCGNWRKLGSL